MSRLVKRNLSAYGGLLIAVLTLIFIAHILLPQPGYALGGHDLRGLFIPWLTIARNAIREGHLPLWDANQFAGYPFLSNPQVAIFYPPTWLAILLPVQIGISWYVAVHIWLAGVGMWKFIRLVGGTRLAAILSALAFCFSGFVMARIEVGHIGLLATNSWLPWLLLATYWSVREGDKKSGVIASLPMTLAFLAGHSASLLYLALAWFVFVVFLCLEEASWRLVLRQVIIIGLVGLVLSAIQLVSFAQFSLVSTRTAEPSFEFATDYSLPLSHLITFLIPEFFGEPVRSGYWSVPNFEELTYYVGVLPLFGLLLSLHKPSKLTWFYLGLMLLGILLALGRYGFLYPLFYDLLPLFRLVRAPGRATFLFSFGFAALLGDAISIWERQSDQERISVVDSLFRWFLAILAMIGVTALAAIGAVFSAEHPSDTSGRLWHQLGGWSLALLLLLVGGSLLRSYLTTPLAETKKRNLTAFGLIALTLVDLWIFGYKFVRLEPVQTSPIWLDAKRIIGDTDTRVLPWGVSIFEQNGAGQVGLQSVFGYNALEIGAINAFVVSVPDPRSTAYDILGAEFVLATGPLDQFTSGERPLELQDHTDSVWVYRRNRPLPIARLATNWEVIKDGASATARVHESDFDPVTSAILDRPPECQIPLQSVSSGTAEVVEKRDGYWRIETESSSPAILVLSETAYPGWKAKVSGEPATIMTAYSAVRAICVPSGKHIVEWEFAPNVYLLGGVFTLIGLLVVVAAFVGRRQVVSEKV